MSAHQHERRVKLIVPSLQVKLTSIFVGMAALSLLLQVGLFTHRLRALARELPNEGGELWGAMRSILVGVFLTSAITFLPVVFVVGILVTFRIAGPMHRLEKHLRAIVRGEHPSDVTLRKGDELQELAGLVNEALAVTRAKAALPARPASSREGQETAA